MQTSMDFFTPNELEKFSSVANKPYHKDNAEDRVTHETVLAPLIEKTQHWAERVVAQMPGFTSQPSSHWLLYGKFKSYTWARIFRSRDAGKGIFFTVGVDAEDQCLIYKLDYQYNDQSPLSKEQQEKCRQYIQGKEKQGWQLVTKGDLDQYNWDKLVEDTTQWFKKKLSHYDCVIDTVFAEKESSSQHSNILVVSPPQKNNHPKPDDDPPGSSKGEEEEYTEHDYIEEAKRNKEIGDAGEQIVITYEQQQLRNMGCFDLVGKVQKVNDKEGYDIQSCDEHGNTKYIEVKTTTGTIDTPFFMTANERKTASEKKGQYYVYRVFNYQRDKFPYQLYIIPDIDSWGDFDPIVFRVTPR